MRALLLVPDSGVHGQDLLGVPVGLRAVFAAIDAGASAIEYDTAGALDGTAPALRGGALDGTAPALRGGALDGTAPALRGGALDGTAPALRGGALDGTAPALRGGALDGTAPALRGGASLYRAWADDPRVTRPLRPRAPASGTAQTAAPAAVGEECFVVRTDAVISPALLTELAPGAALCDASGVNVAARLMLSDGADALAALAAAPAQAFTPDRYRYAILLSSKQQVRRARRALLGALVKPSDGPVSRHFNRPISIAITQLLVPLGVSADQMTWVTAFVALAGAWLATHPDWRSQTLGAVLFQASSVLDGCDGEIARLTRRSSPNGALFDSLVDDLSNFLFFTGLSWGVAHDIAYDGARWPMIAGTATALSYLGVIAVQYTVVLRATGYGDKTSFWVSEAGTPHSPLMAFFHGLLRRNVFVAVIMLAVLAGAANWVVALLPFATLGTLSASVRRALAT